MITKITADLTTNEVLIDFTCSIDCNVTLAIYDGDDLIHNIIPALPYKLGPHRFRWNKQDFLQQPLAADNYTFKKIESVVEIDHQLFANTHGWRGLDFVRDILYADGYLHFASGYNEQEQASFRAPVNNLKAVEGLTHRRAYTDKMCKSQNRKYLKCYGELDGQNIDFVCARERSITNAEVIFPHGQPLHMNGNYSTDPYASVIFLRRPVDSGQFPEQHIQNDLEAAWDDSVLFLTRWQDNKVLIYVQATGVTVEVPMAKPYRVCRQNDTLYWFVTDGILKQFSFDKNALSLTETGKVLNLPSVDDIVCNPDGSLISVTQTGAIQQLKEFNTDTLALVSTVGELGGTLTNAQIAGVSRLGLRPYTAAIDYTPTGRWLVDYANRRVLHINSTTSLVDNVTVYQSATYALSSDTGNTDTVYIGFKEYRLDYTKRMDEPGACELVANYESVAGGIYEGSFVAMSYVTTMENGRKYCIVQAGPNYLVEVTSTGFVQMEACSYASGSVGLFRHGLYYATYLNRIPGEKVRYWRKAIIYNTDGSISLGPNELLFDPTITNLDPVIGGGSFSMGYKVGEGYITHDTSKGIRVSESYGYKLGRFEKGSSEFTWRTQYVTGVENRSPFPLDDRFENGGGTNNPAGHTSTANDYIFTSQNCEFYVFRGNQVNMRKIFHANGMYLGWYGTYKGLLDYDPVKMAGNGFSSWSYPIANDRVINIHGDESYNGAGHLWDILFKHVVLHQIDASINALPVIASGYGIKLLNNLPLLQTLVDGADGWHRIPAIDQFGPDKEISTTWDYKNQTIRLRTNDPQPGDEVKVWKDFNNEPCSSWILKAKIAFVTSTFHGGVSFAVKDGSGVSIVDINYKVTPGNNNPFVYETILVNGVAVYKYPLVNSAPDNPIEFNKLYQNELQDIVIACYGGILRVFYADTPPVIVQLNAGANMSLPTRFQALCARASTVPAALEAVFGDGEQAMAFYPYNTKQTLNATKFLY